MSAAMRCGRRLGGITLLAVILAGCASLETLGPPVEDISEKRRERSREAAQQFDRHRDVAEFEAARVRWEEGDSHACAEILHRILARSPDHLEARLLFAELLLADNRPNEAISCLEPALAAHPSDARVHHLMGSLLDAIGQKADALVYYEQAVSLRPANEVYAVCYETLASEQDAEASVQNAAGEALATSPPFPEVSSDPRGVQADERFGRETGDRGSGPASSMDRARGVEAPQPTTICVLSGQEDTSPRSEGTSPASSPSSRPKASRIGDVSPQESPKPFVPDSARPGRIGETGGAAGSAYSGDMAGASAAELIEQGRSAMSDGTTELALAYFREAMALKPDDPRIAISAAASALRHSRPEVAVALLEPLLEVFADSAAIRRILGAAYYRLGEYESSQVVLQQALSLDKSSGLSYFLMGCTLAKLGRLTAAETHFGQARRLDPRYAFRR